MRGLRGARPSDTAPWSFVMLDEQLAAALARRERNGTRRRLRPELVARADACADFSSNDYLGVARSAEAHAAFERRAAVCRLGSTGSRLLDGDSRAHTALEERLAKRFRAPAALLFNSGFDANVSLLSTLPQPGDLVVYDELVHASMHDGMRQCRARCVPFRHNDPADLGRVLHAEHEALATSPPPNVILALEGVYSMDGDVCALRELCSVLEEHVRAPGTRHVLLDEAHSVGAYGLGVCASLGAESLVSARLVTFGKALGAAGAVVLCPPLWREYLINYARPLVYSTALSPVGVAAIDASLDLLDNEELRRRAEVLHARVRAVHAEVRTVSWAAPPPAQAGSLPPSPVVPVETPEAHALAAYLQAAGFLVRPVTYPTVPRGRERVRVCVHYHNTEEEVRRLGEALRRWVPSGGTPGGAGGAPPGTPGPTPPSGAAQNPNPKL